MRLETEDVWRRLLAWAGTVVAATWILVFVVTSVRVVLSKPRSHNDYQTFANAARHWVAGEDLYCQFDAAGFYDDYRYSPLVATALVPFSILPDRLGSVAWRLVNLAAFLGALGWWGRKVLTPAPTRLQLALLSLALLPLCTGNINNGQSNPLVLALMLGAVAAVTEERWNLCTAFLALAILIKIYPIAIGLLLVSLYPRKLALRLAAATAVGLALPFLFQHSGYVVGQYAHWYKYLLAEDRQGMPLRATYRDLRLLFRACSMPLDPRAYVGLQLATATGAALACLWAKRAGWSQGRVLTLLTGLGCCWMTVFGVATESCTYVLLAPSGVWAIIRAFRERRGIVLQSMLWASYVLFLAAQVANWFRQVADFHALGVQPLGGLLLIAGLVAAEVGRSGRAIPVPGEGGESGHALEPGVPGQAA